MGMEYVHLEIGEEIDALAGSYTPLKELRLEQNGREALCVVGMATVEGACCNLDGSSGYAVVPGYIVTWKDRRNDSGLLVSQVEPIADEMTKRRIARIINETESIQNIEFW